MDKAADNRYKSCTLTDIAVRAGMDLRTFQFQLEQHHLIQMIRLGWLPWRYALKPSVVKYLIDEFIDKPIDADDDDAH